MRFALSLVLVALPATAFADDGGRTPQPRVAHERHQAVIGGAAVVEGKWPDAAALMFGPDQGCSGTLIAPTVVLTAGHCVNQGAPSSVRVGSISELAQGEHIVVKTFYEYPSSQTSVDAGLLVLQTPATTPPRAIADGWAKFDIENGAAIQLVGFGTTDRDGTVDSTVLLEAASTITDAGCTTSSGCNSAARPLGELGAGGNGIDTCPGDSGGPLYLLTSYGNFLAGITSRGYDNNQYYCSEGGIYGRADKITEWIETTTGVKIAHGPLPVAEPIETVRGNPGETTIDPKDPKDTGHTFAITKQPQYGKAAVSDGGVVRVCANKDVVGGDSVTVTVTDASDATRTLDLTIPVLIDDGSPDGSCDPLAFGEDAGGGCCDTRRSARGSIPLVLFVALALRRRRRPR